MTLWVVPHVFWCLYGTAISPSDLLLAASRPLLSALVAAALAFGAQLYFGGAASALFRLLLAGGIMVIVYFLILLFVMGQRTLYMDLLRGLSTRSLLESKEPGKGSVS